MSKQTDKERIVALQKALRVARRAMEPHAYLADISAALDEINRLDWMTNPPPLQGLCGHEPRSPR